MYEKSFFTRSNDVPTRYSLSGKLREKAQSSGLETIKVKTILFGEKSSSFHFFNDVHGTPNAEKSQGKEFLSFPQ